MNQNNVKPKGKSIDIYYEKLWSLFCHCLCGDLIHGISNKAR